MTDELSPFYPERRLRLDRTKPHRLSGPFVDRIQKLCRILQQSDDPIVITAMADPNSPEGWTVRLVSKKRESYTDGKTAHSIRENLTEIYHALRRELYDLFSQSPAIYQKVIEAEAEDKNPLDHEWFYSLDGSPDLVVQHQLKGPMVDQIKTMMKLAYDVNNVIVYAESDPQKPEWWRIIACTSKSVILKGDIQCRSESVPTIVRGLHQIHSLMYTHLHNQQLQYSKTLEEILKEGISGSWGFQEG